MLVRMRFYEMLFDELIKKLERGVASLFDQRIYLSICTEMCTFSEEIREIYEEDL